MIIHTGHGSKVRKFRDQYSSGWKRLLRTDRVRVIIRGVGVCTGQIPKKIDLVRVACLIKEDEKELGIFMASYCQCVLTIAGKRMTCQDGFLLKID